MTNTLDTVSVFTDMANEAYHGERAHVSRSAAHRYRDQRLGGRSQRFVEQYGKSLFAGNSSTTFGTLVDKACEAMITGTDWRQSVIVPPLNVLAADGSRRGRAYIEWRESIPGDSLETSAKDYEKVSDIVESIMEHRGARALIEASTHSQYSVFWTDDDGHKRKARADGVTPECWYDLKTTSSEWWELKHSFRRFGYDWQDVWYRQAARVVGGWGDFKFPFVVVQTFAPYDVAVVTLPEDVLKHAEDEIRETLNLIRQRRESGVYVPENYHESFELVF